MNVATTVTSTPIGGKLSTVESMDPSFASG